MITTAYELRIHLRRSHDLNLVGADWGTLQAVHTAEHRPGTDQSHEHDEGPNVREWARDCVDFGCSEEAH